jgi:hypothetical protein
MVTKYQLSKVEDELLDESGVREVSPSEVGSADTQTAKVQAKNCPVVKDEGADGCLQ